MTGRRRIPLWLAVLLFLAIPLLELYVLIQIGQEIGVGWTLLLLIADSMLGAWLVKREGRKAFQALGDALATGRMPAREIADGMLVLAGGILMLSPGFVLDVAGLLLVLPFTRPLARRAMTRFVSARLVGPAGGVAPGSAPGPDARRPRPGPNGPVVEGEVIDEPPERPDEEGQA